MAHIVLPPLRIAVRSITILPSVVRFSRVVIRLPVTLPVSFNLCFDAWRVVVLTPVMSDLRVGCLDKDYFDINLRLKDVPTELPRH